MFFLNFKFCGQASLDAEIKAKQEAGRIKKKIGIENYLFINNSVIENMKGEHFKWNIKYVHKKVV